LVNLLPVFGLDGYRMVEHALGALHLQRHTLRFVAGLLRGRVGDYPARARLVYSTYALVAAAVLGPLAAGVLTVWYRTLADLWGPVWAVLALAAEGVLVALLVRWLLRRGRRKES